MYQSLMSWPVWFNLCKFSILCLYTFNSFLASSGFCNPLIALANSLDPDQDQQNVGPDRDPNHLALIVSLKEFCEKAKF